MTTSAVMEKFFICIPSHFYSFTFLFLHVSVPLRSSLFLFQNLCPEDSQACLHRPLSRPRQHFHLFTFLFLLYSSFSSILQNSPAPETGRPHIGSPRSWEFSLLSTEEDVVHCSEACSPAPTSPYLIAPECCTGRTAYSPQPHQYP